MHGMGNAQEGPRRTTHAQHTKLKALCKYQMLFAALLGLLAVQHSAADGLTVELFANSVMRGKPISTQTLPNGFNLSLARILANSSPPVDDGEVSVRITGTLTADSVNMTQWYAFGAQVEPTAWLRLWIDDHR